MVIEEIQGAISRRRQNGCWASKTKTIVLLWLAHQRLTNPLIRAICQFCECALLLKWLLSCNKLPPALMFLFSLASIKTRLFFYFSQLSVHEIILFPCSPNNATLIKNSEFLSLQTFQTTQVSLTVLMQTISINILWVEGRVTVDPQADVLLNAQLRPLWLQ